MCDVKLSDVKLALEKAPWLILSLAVKTILYRVQPSRHDAEPRNYKRDSATRFGDPLQEVGVFYLGYSEAVVIAESFQQQSDDQEVRFSLLEQSSMHQLETVRELKLVDLTALAGRLGYKPRDVIQAKGKDAVGYKLTRTLAKACMDLGYDGLVYSSAVYCPAGSMEGRNVVLFEGRGTQVSPVSHKPLLSVELWDGERPTEFLENLGVDVV